MSNKYDLRRLQLLQLDILKEVKRVCDEHNLTFYIMNGTCLGAIRHKGAIPWDDDIDIGMYVADFDKFVTLQKELDNKYFIQTIDTDPEFCTMIARVRMQGTTIIEKDFEDCDINHGVFIDIYPLFSYPTNPISERILSWKSLVYRLLLAGRPPKNHGILAKKIGNIILRVYSGTKRDKYIRGFHQKLRNGDTRSRYVAFLYGMDVHLFRTIKYERTWFGKPTMVQYENTTMPAPTDWDSYLKIRYNDYMKLPPVDKRSSYHSFEFVDLDNSYERYKGIKYLKNSAT